MTTPLLLDGSMGHEIVNRGGKSGYGEWGIDALHENPAIIGAIHREYIDAGADVITTNTYSVTRTRLRHVGIEDRLAELAALGGQLAVEARTARARPDVQIAASIGPLEGSYINSFTLSYDEMVAEFSELMTLLAPYVDIYLGETFSTRIEAQAFLTAAQDQPKPIWVAVSLDDSAPAHLRGGETLVSALATIAPFAPDAVLLNCCMPESIDQQLTTLQRAGVPYGGYANGFVKIPDNWQKDRDVVAQIASRTDLSPAVYSQHAQNWLQAGASIVGGCCDIGPEHIAHLRQTLDAQA